MSKSVFNEFQPGDAASKITDRYGEPDAFEPIPHMAGAQAWTYKKSGEICSFVVFENMLIDSACRKDPNYVNPVAAFLKGFGEGMSQASRENSPSRNISCNSTRLGNNITTNCR